MPARTIGLPKATRGLVSLVSAWGRNWHYLCGRIEKVETGDIVEIGNIHTVFAHLAENMIGWRKRLGEYPTLSAIFHSPHPNCINYINEKGRAFLLSLRQIRISRFFQKWQDAAPRFCKYFW
jgi:hypothetical protein